MHPLMLAALLAEVTCQVHEAFELGTANSRLKGCCSPVNLRLLGLHQPRTPDLMTLADTWTIPCKERNWQTQA